VSTYLSNITLNTKGGGYINESVLKDYNPKILELPLELDVPFVDIFESMWSHRAAYTTDGLHITSSEYTVMSATWLDVILSGKHDVSFLSSVYHLLLLN